MSTIALVDDDRNILTSVSMTLEAEGYNVITYNDGQSALDGFAQKYPDIAVLDIKMPRMDGMDLLHRIRQKSDMPVIFLTSKDDEIDEVLVPTEEVIEVRRGKKVTTERRFMPRLCAGAYGDVGPRLSPDQLDQPCHRVPGAAGPADADARCRGQRHPQPRPGGRRRPAHPDLVRDRRKGSRSTTARSRISTAWSKRWTTTTSASR